jgi:hypothetical protein
MRSVMVQYTLKPERGAENEELVRAVYEELDQARPDGFHYATFKLADGVTFIHLATHEDADNPLRQIGAFQRFQEAIADRCDKPPVVAELDAVGSYRFGGQPS